MARLKRLRIQGCRLPLKHLKAILESKVEAVTIGDGNDMEKDVDISSLPPTSLAKLASELKELTLHNSLMQPTLQAADACLGYQAGRALLKTGKS